MSISTTKSTKTCELLSKFMLSQGLPYHSIRSPSFRELLKHFDPKTEPPTEKELEQSLKGAEPRRMDCGKGGGTISVTVDMSDCGGGNGDERVLVFSIHHFEDSYERTGVVHFEKLEIAQFSWPTLWSLIRNAFSTYSNFSTINVVFSSPDLADVFKPPSEFSEAVTTRTRHDFVCFYHYISEFARKVLGIEEVQKSMRVFEKLLQVLKTNSDFYQCFVEFQKCKNLDPILPPTRRGCWQEELFFLTRCLEMDPTFRELDSTISWSDSDSSSDAYISTASFNQLLHVQKVLEECQQALQDLTSSESSVSQVLPTVSRIQKFLSMYTNFGDVQIQNLNALIQSLFEETMASVVESQRHNFATWLDPRYASNRNVFSEEQLESIGEEILKDSGDSESLHSEIQSYLRILNEKPPDASVRPFFWWLFHQERLPILANMARGFLTCPAVAIDAGYYFGGEGGKFSHISRVYSQNSDFNWLKLAGYQQEFQGRGAGMGYRRSERFAKPELRFKTEQSKPEQSRGTKRKLEEPETTTKRVRESSYMRKTIKWTPNKIEQNPAATLRRALEREKTPSEDVPMIPNINEVLLKEVKMEVVEPSEPSESAHGGVEEDDPDEVDPEAVLSALAPLWNGKGEKKRNQCKRSCVLCHRMRLHEEVKNVTILGEKLLMTMALMHTGQVTATHAQSVYVRQKKSFFCREHYAEAAEEVYKALHVKGMNELRKCTMDKLQPYCDQITEGQVDLKTDQVLRGFIVNFIEKYLNSGPAATSENHSDNDGEV